MSQAAVSKPKCFTGDADSLVDDLIAACETKPAPSSYTGYGRELVPYNFDCGSTGPQTKSPNAVLRGPLEQTKKRASVKGARNRGEATDSPSKSARKTARRNPEEATAVVSGSTAARQKYSNVKNGPTNMCVTVASPIMKTASVAAAVAVPSFVSPKPEAVPLPTSSLLQRAAVNKQRGSPTHNAGFYPGAGFYGLHGMEAIAKPLQVAAA